MWYLYILIGLLLGGGGLYLCLLPKIKTTKAINTEIEEKNQKLADNNLQLQKDQASLSSNISAMKFSIAELTDRETHLKDSLQFLQQQKDKIDENLDKYITQLSNEYEAYRNQYQQEYLDTMRDGIKAYSFEILNAQNELSSVNNELNDLRAKIDAIVKQLKRQEEMRQNADFYRLNISDIDLEEIKKLREVGHYLRDATPLNKVIYKVYYEKSYTDLIGRVVGQKPITGIYKITNIINGKCYVGQAMNMSERWKQHIRRGVGADPATRNKLYPAMLADGVENFTFEILEECAAQALNEREQYWQQVYHARDFGYSIK